MSTQQVSRFLSGENTNNIIQQIVNNLSKYGRDINIKDLQNKIYNFMHRVCQQYPNSSIDKLNNFVINECTQKYLKTRPLGNRNSNQDLEAQLEQEIMDRRYATNSPQQTAPEPPDFTQPIGTSSQQQPQFYPPQQNRSSGMSLSQATGNMQQQEQPNNHEASQQPPMKRQKYYDEPEYMREITLSLNKTDLVNSSNNIFTFSWNKNEVLQDFRQDFQIQLRYITLPKSLPYLLVKYNGTSKETRSRVYSATGKNYSAKLIPCHTTDEYTTYQALKHDYVQFDNLPSTLTFHLFSPDDMLNLNNIIVQKATKHESKIRIMTKGMHNLSEGDSLTLEFPQHFTCYKVTNMEILNDREIIFDSPFVGYFSSNFRLLRNNWNLDITLSCQYIHEE